MKVGWLSMVGYRVFLHLPDKRFWACLADLPLYLSGMQFVTCASLMVLPLTTSTLPLLTSSEVWFHLGLVMIHTVKIDKTFSLQSFSPTFQMTDEIGVLKLWLRIFSMKHSDDLVTPSPGFYVLIKVYLKISQCVEQFLKNHVWEF